MHMTNLSKRIEILANVAIIIIAVMIGVVIVNKYFFAKPAAQRPTIAIGSKVVLPGVNWAGNGKTLVLALQKGCHFCSESAPFYQRLVQIAPAKGVKLVAVLPQTAAEAQQYLQSLSVPIADIRQSPLDTLNVGGTPTLILVDDKGQVTASWVGKIPGDKEAEVLARL
jgi:hypothetical protein